MPKSGEHPSTDEKEAEAAKRARLLANEAQYEAQLKRLKEILDLQNGSSSGEVIFESAESQKIRAQIALGELLLEEVRKLLK